MYNYLKYERKLKRSIRIILYNIYPLVKLIEMIASFYSSVDHVLTILKFYIIIENICLLLGLCVIFGLLYYLLNTKHKFEFYRNRDQMVAFFSLNLILLLATIVMICLKQRSFFG